MGKVMSENENQKAAEEVTSDAEQAAENAGDPVENATDASTDAGVALGSTAEAASVNWKPTNETQPTAEDADEDGNVLLIREGDDEPKSVPFTTIAEYQGRAYHYWATPNKRRSTD